MVVTSTLGVEASHGHDVAANVDGGAPLPGGQNQINAIMMSSPGEGNDNNFAGNNNNKK